MSRAIGTVTTETPILIKRIYREHRPPFRLLVTLESEDGTRSRCAEGDTYISRVVVNYDAGPDGWDGSPSARVERGR